MRRILIALVVVAALAGLAAGGGYLWLKNEIERAGPHGEDVTVLIPPGSGLVRIGALLQDADTIRSAKIFGVAARLIKQDRGLRAGEFLLPAGASLKGVLDVLRDGKTVVRRLTIPEGLSSREAMALLAAAEGLQGSVPRTPAEGQILPETYHYSYYDERAAVLDRMEKALRDTLAALWPKRQEGLPLKTPEEALVLASIVEKETGVAAERPRVAAVFINRLRRGMRLQSDPTVVFGITRGKEDLGRPISRKDLKTPTDYNTYVIPALPPAPISNPGKAAIEAVLNPIASDELYFVADGTGGHAFAKTLREHNRNVRRWRQIERQRKKEGQ